MYLALSYDHRIIDGKEAVSFLKTINKMTMVPNLFLGEDLWNDRSLDNILMEYIGHLLLN